MFFDEVHRINNWEEAINSYRVGFKFGYLCNGAIC